MTEVVIATFIIFIGFFIMITVFKLSALHATQSRHLVIAQMIADSLMEEMRAHTYGDPAPAYWTEPEQVLTVFQGRKIQISFEKKIEYKNGSFIGKKDDDTDEVTVTIRWVEGTGPHAKGVVKNFAEKLRVRRTKL
ncbi:MAG: hypothetical protein LWY06_00780 [Firmicutes bacterium]|nr:hypothetical protein [Bacillota bacterium]